MVRSLNPNAAENREPNSSGSKSPAPTGAGGTNDPSRGTADVPQRRNFLTAAVAGTVGFVLSLFPVAVGAVVFLDPLLGKKKRKSKSIRVATLDSLPADGTPVRVPVMSDLVDAWTRQANQPIGAVYLRRIEDQVIAFNAICPHAGCFVNFAADRNLFQCPCHTSSFDLQGNRESGHSPSPRDMDTLEVDQEKLSETGEVWIEFVNYYPGKAERIAKS